MHLLLFDMLSDPTLLRADVPASEKNIHRKGSERRICGLVLGTMEGLMGAQGFNLATLRTQLTLAEQKKDTARLNLMSQRLNNANATALAAAEQKLADATAEVERLKRELSAAERAGA